VDVQPLAGQVAEGRLLSMRVLERCLRKGMCSSLKCGGIVGQSLETVETCVELGV
jgi:hypothetical protein